MSFARLRQAVVESVGGLPRQFWWLWTSTLVNRLGAFIATFLALYLTVDRGYSPTYAGLVGALYGLGGAVSSIGAGVLADRLGRRPTLLIAQLATAVSVAALGFMEHPLAIAAVAGVAGMATNGSRPATQAMIADIVAPEDRIRAFALNYWAINLGFAVSSTAAGLLARYSYQLLFLGEAVMVLACALVVYTRLPESRPERGRTGGAGAKPSAPGRAVSTGTADAAPDRERVSLLTVVRHGRFMAVVGLNLLLALLFQQGFVALPVSMGLEGFSSTDFGLVIAVNGLLIVLLQIPVTRLLEHRDPLRPLVLSALLTGVGFGLHAFAGSAAFYAVAVSVWTLGEIINSPTQMGLVVRLSPLHGRGRYQGMYTFSWSVAALSAPLLGGFVIDTLGADTLWALCAVLGVVGAAGYALLLRGLPPAEGNVREGPPGPAEAAEAGLPSGQPEPERPVPDRAGAAPDLPAPVATRAATPETPRTEGTPA
ncbi:MFS transporter [Streptomyces sp. JJ36]|uniref:MDR family MFS transporter n=1 Tax=Streptomyces sp. JJ36 TaxID=2736645 RepID=UPI001F0302F1|nr:MFS transporter [Streptomyces sp. JJ36]MCF6523804.1 MFS transporter [Streptomyces sp. JJ36]